MNYEVTIALIKPDITSASRTAEVLEVIESGIGDTTILDVAMLRWTASHVREWYAPHVAKPWFGDFVEFMTSAPMVHVAVGGPGIVRNLRDFLGATDPKKAEMGTLRGMFGDKDGPMMRNAVHASDGVRSVVDEWNLTRAFLNQPQISTTGPAIYARALEIAHPAMPGDLGFGSTVFPDAPPWSVDGVRVWTPASWLVDEETSPPLTSEQLAPWLVEALGLPDAGAPNSR